MYIVEVVQVVDFCDGYLNRLSQVVFFRVGGGGLVVEMQQKGWQRDWVWED